MISTRMADSGMMIREIQVMTLEMENIMISTPTSVTKDVMNVVMDWFREEPSVSTSLVMRDWMSPIWLDSK